MILEEFLKTVSYDRAICLIIKTSNQTITKACTWEIGGLKIHGMPSQLFNDIVLRELLLWPVTSVDYEDCLVVTISNPLW